jgi:hypothetical protein
MPCDIVQHIWKPPSLTPVATKDPYHYMVETIAPSLRFTLSMNGYQPDKESDDQDFIFLIALNGIIYEIDDTLSVLMRDDGIYGIGSGASYAIGALHAGASWKQAMRYCSEEQCLYCPTIHNAQAN